MPLGSDAPGAPGVEPPIADGQAGAVGVGVGVGDSLTATGVFVKLWPLTSLLAVVVVNDRVADVAASDEEDDCAGAAGVADVADVVVWLPVSTAAIADLLSEEFDNAEAELLAVNVTPPAREMEGSEEPVPWMMITAATTAVAINTAFFNVCTPIQRLHCPPNWNQCLWET
jgi:hypothetical protein